MKRILGMVFMILGALIGFASLYAGVSLMFSQIVYRGMPGIAANVMTDIFFFLLAGVLIFFATWWGTLHEKRILAILFFFGSIFFLVLSINMFVGFANSIPSPSKEWLTNMAWSRAHIIGEIPVIDDMLITQGRIATSGMEIVALIVSAMLAWFGKYWFSNKSQTRNPNAGGIPFSKGDLA